MRRNKNWKRVLITAVITFIVYFTFCLPDPLFNDPVSTVIVDRNGELLGARIAADEQWRFPHNHDVPEKFALAIKTYEDKRFDYHPGFDPIALTRAIYTNLTQDRIVSGGSTLTMQTIRLSRKGKQRTIPEKLVEIVKAVRLELGTSKQEILSLYASNAPFGGNIVGLDAAAWKYFSRPPEYLSWAETATLAVLPNAPGMIHPGRNREQLLRKRNFLLKKLFEAGHMDSLTCILSTEEPLPGRPESLPSEAYHLLERIAQDYPEKTSKSIVATTIDIKVQKRLNELAHFHHLNLKNNGIYNLAAMVVDMSSGEVRGYVGNTPWEKGEHGYSVDIITSPRSSGSLFKPFLYAAMLSDGDILPKTIIPDIPSNFYGFTPKNFDHQYSGAVPADEALYRSLNVPAVRMLSEYGVHRFYSLLQKIGVNTLDFKPSHYGLSLIVGGAETTLWDMSAAYRDMANVLQYYSHGTDGSSYLPSSGISILQEFDKTLEKDMGEEILSPAAVWHTLEALSELKRPGLEYYWQQFASTAKIAWKTGTSFGYRDAWSIGCTPQYLVAVWCGNADGEGRPGLIGVEAAAPLMFDVFNAIDRPNDWFQEPLDELTPLEVCRASGFRAREYCNKDTVSLINSGVRSRPCPYHKEVFLDASEKWQVIEGCEPPFNMVKKPIFVLPPAMEWYYKRRNPSYSGVPDYRPDCERFMVDNKKDIPFELIYPTNYARVIIPLNLNETRSSTVFQASHRFKDAALYWHIDQTYIGKTQGTHDMAINASPGKHVLTVVDNDGNILKRNFEVLR